MTERLSAHTCTPDVLARLLQLASAASPVGSYAYSDAMEFAVHAGDVHDETSARAWIGGLLGHSVCALDVPVLAQMYGAWRDDRAEDALAASAWLMACREASELRLSDRQQGQALARILIDLGVDEARPLCDDPRVSYACAFALACVRFDVPRDHACVAFAFAWLENMVLCAIKLVPLGQRAGQRMTFDLSGGLWQRCESAMSVDQALIAAGAPGQALASAQHEMQPTRLFRS